MVTHTYPRYPGEGTAPFLDSIARSLVDRGYLVDVVLPFHPEFRYPSGDGVRFFPYRYSPRSGWAPWGFGNSLRGDARLSIGGALLMPAVALALQRRVAALLRDGAYDVVHAHWA